METVFKNDLFKGQRILITGGGTGLGFQMAQTLAALGAELHLCGRRPEVVKEAAEQLQETYGTPAFSHALDIRNYDAIDEMMSKIWEDHGPLNGLVNNAAGNFISRSHTLSPNGFNAISDIVLRGTFYITQAAGKRWIEHNLPGSIVSIVVTWVWTGSPFVVPSAMSKAGVDAMTKSLAVEWGGHNIRLNAIAPGVIPTEGASRRLRPKNTQSTGMIARNPMKTLGTGQDIGELAAFLLGTGSRWINGQTIALDGGDWLANGAYFTEYLDWTEEDWQTARQAIDAQNKADRQGRADQ
ncbi:SDR family oxidoreductase [Orrella sp. 11846]|uniref:SDR family oxidoreductase n=1 Tax=Orrella sp. 11846 TaxID=3409913 RepID=UPI003B5C4F49